MLKEKYEKLQRELELERQNRSNPLINAARGRDENGVNNDEVERGSKAIKNIIEDNDGVDKDVLAEMMAKLNAGKNQFITKK